jgi:hypothetical protein
MFESNESLRKLKNNLSRENLSFFVDCFWPSVTLVKKAITSSDVIFDISELPYSFLKPAKKKLIIFYSVFLNSFFDNQEKCRLHLMFS